MKKRARRHAFSLLAAALSAAALSVPAAEARADLTYVTSFGGQGSGPGQFFNPVGVAVSGDLVYVADTANGRIVLLATVPEPSSLVLTSAGLAGLVAWGMRCRAARAN